MLISVKLLKNELTLIDLVLVLVDKVLECLTRDGLESVAFQSKKMVIDL